MLEVSSFEDVACIRMSQTMGGKPLAWVACYLVDGLLVDTGSAHVSEELMRFLEKRVKFYPTNQRRTTADEWRSIELKEQV